MSQNRDRTVVLRVENLTAAEEEKIADGIRKLKGKVAPEGKASLLQGKTKDLPGKIRQIGFDEQ